MSMHMFTGSKGDPLCPLGFHPQVRWPTRCKRCFRDYKEHGSRTGRDDSMSSLKKDDVTMSTPSLTTWGSSLPSTKREDNRTAAAMTNESSNETGNRLSTNNYRLNSSWTSTPDLTESDTPTVSVKLPRRRTTVDLSDSLEAAARSTEFTVRRRTNTSAELTLPSETATQAITKSKDDADVKINNNRPFSPKSKVSTSTNTTEHLVKKTVKKKEDEGKPFGKLKTVTASPEVEFIFKVKSSKVDTKKTNKKEETSIPAVADDIEEDDNTSVAGTETTDTTLVNESEFQDQIESLKRELEATKLKCEKLEREKSDILLRRLATYETTSSKTTASEVLKLQQKVNELMTQSEDLKDDKKSLSLRVKELERELDQQKNTIESVKRADELQAKLAAAETLCEELMDENEEMKKELRELEDEIEEMQDNFREDQADEYTSLRKELEQTTKNCRILSFKLRKAERRAEQLEVEKLETEQKYKDLVGGQQGVDYVEKIRKLESDLVVSNEVANRLTKELEEANQKLKIKDGVEKKKKAPLLGALPKISSGERVSRASLTRGGSQEDPQQLLRDLQDSMEREADLREQLKFAEEEAATLRKKAARMEEDNDSLALQLKKMATKAKSRKHSPNRLTPEPFLDKDEGISEEDDPVELRLLLELNEQETAVLRRKVDELESEIESKKLKIKELEEKIENEKQTVKKPSTVLSAKPMNPVEIGKLKVIEEECGELRKKLIEKERENERLQQEIQLGQKRKGSLVKSRSLDSSSEQQALDLKRQLQLVEQEAAILRTKIQALETENEKLTAENKKLQLLRGTKKRADTPDRSDKNNEKKLSELEDKLVEYQKQIQELKEKADKKSVPGKSSAELEKLKREIKEKTTALEEALQDRDKARESLKRLHENTITDLVNFHKARTPKKPTDMHTKVQMKKMVEELEVEVGDILVALQKASNSKGTAENLVAMKTQIKDLEEKLMKAHETSKSECEKLMRDKENEKSLLSKQLDEEKAKLEKIEGEKKKVEESLRKMEKERNDWKNENKLLEEAIEKLKFEQKNSVLAHDEVAVFMKKLESLNKELENEKENTRKIQEQLKTVTVLQEEKTVLQKEVTDRNKQLLEADKKIKESEEKVKKLEKSIATYKSKTTKLEKSIEEAENQRLEREERWKQVEHELNGQEVLNNSLKVRISHLEAELEKKVQTIRSLEESVRLERARATDVNAKAGSAENREIASLRSDLSEKIREIDQLRAKLDTLEKYSKTNEENHQMAVDELLKEKQMLEKKATDLEIDLNTERKKSDIMKEKHDKELKNRETELTALRLKIRSLEQSTGTSNKKIAEVRDELSAKIQKLETELAREKQEYEDLTVKYELLEEEHVVTKAQLVMEKEHLVTQASSVRREADTLAKELTTLRETFSTKQDQWIKEKVDFQEELKESVERTTRLTENKFQLEKSHLIAMHEEQISIAEGFKQKNDAMQEQMEHMRKENDDLRKKLDDFDKVSKIQRQMTAESTQIEMELREMKLKFAAEEKNHKAEMSALKLRYEGRVNLITEELQSSQAQISRFKRERDNFRHMLEEAQTQMADLKSGKKKESRLSSSSNDESEDAKGTIAALEQQVSCMEDELSEARLECSRLKTELISEKSSWEVKLSELQSRVNELEEEKILSSGRTKIPGLRTRMELAWQKEREEQHRLLQETSTLARDLRQTLFEVERERDKERLEAKRRQEQLKRATEEEMEENRKKITELQCDLLELRDAHAKLRTTNEKLRREKERETRAQRRRDDDSAEKKLVNALLNDVETVIKLVPSVPAAGEVAVKKKIKMQSRETTPAKEDPNENLHLTLQRLQRTLDDIQQCKVAADLNTDRSRRSASIGLGAKRAGSSEPETAADPALLKRIVQTRKPSLYRKSLSLSETTDLQEQAIWKENEQEGSLNSLQSLDEHVDHRIKNLGKRETSMDSRLSGGSTQSEVTPGEKKKKKGLFGKIKKLTRSRSDDESSMEDFSAIHSAGGSDSDMSTTNDIKGSKKDLKGRLTGMFKKSTPSRDNSAERTLEDSLKTLPKSTRQSPAKTTNERSATLGRALDRTNNPAASYVKTRPK